MPTLRFIGRMLSGDPKFWVLPDILRIRRKRRTRPSSGALLWDWDPQKGPQGAKKSAKSAILTSSMTVELLLVALR